MSIRFLFITILCLVLSACVKPPQYELDTAEQVLEQARQLDAGHYAPTEYQAAQAALRDGREQMTENRFKSAQETLTLALEHARRAVTITQEERSREAAEMIRRKVEAEKARQAAEQERLKLEAAQQRAVEEETKRIAEEPPPKKTEPKITAPAPIKKAAEYKVGEGENLWTIAAQPTVYADGYLWPLLYQANRDQIKNPRQIFPGQTLSIRRDLTPEEIEEARQKAKASDIFPLPQD